MKFGDYLRKKREGKGWTQPVAAQQIGIEQSYLSKLETGKSYPSEDIFDRLLAAYSIDCDELTQHVESVELAKLSDIKSVRIAVLGQHQRDETSSRKWMIAGLLSLMIGGASLGAALLPDTAEQSYLYRSEGVLQPGEPLDAFDGINSKDASVREAMLNRLDPEDQAYPYFRGDSFVENTSEGPRFYELYAKRQRGGVAATRFFIIPALAFSFGSIGCFLMGFRWRRRR